MSKGKCNACGETAELEDAEERGLICEECIAPNYIRCCNCGKKTTHDPVYEDLCSSCCRVGNE